MYTVSHVRHEILKCISNISAHDRLKFNSNVSEKSARCTTLSESFILISHVDITAVSYVSAQQLRVISLCQYVRCFLKYTVWSKLHDPSAHVYMLLKWLDNLLCLALFSQKRYCCITGST